MRTVVNVFTALVVMLNVAEVLPAGVPTLAGIDAAARLLLESQTVTPPPGAARVSLIVPVERPPPCSLPGWSVTDATCTLPGVGVGVGIGVGVGVGVGVDNGSTQRAVRCTF